jgi:hypothetical protein
VHRSSGHKHPPAATSPAPAGSDGAKLATKTTRVVQQRLPIRPSNQAQHADDLQQRRNQAGQDRCNQGRETRLLIYRQLLVGFTEKRRHDLYQGLRQHLDLGRKAAPAPLKTPLPSLR